MFTNVTDNTFDTEVIAAHGLVVAYFWAEWCAPCKSFAPIFKEVAEKYADREDIKFVKVNVEECVEAASQVGLRAVPTIVLFKEGAQLGRIGPSGSNSNKDTFVKFIEATGNIKLEEPSQ